MVFQPVNTDHSIQMVAFTAALSGPLKTSTVETLKAQPAAWKAALPALDLVQSIEFPPPPPSALANARPTMRVGLDFSVKRPDGASVWALRFHGNSVVVECTRYTRWDLVWAEAKNYLYAALARLGEVEADLNVTSLGLWYIDTFVSPDPMSDTKDLYVDSKYLPKFAFEQGAEWHAHTGWFERRAIGRILHNLNVDTQVTSRSDPVSGESFGEAVSTVTHSQVCTRFLSVNLISVNWQEFDAEFEQMHRNNKQILQDLLSPAIKYKVQLNS